MLRYLISGTHVDFRLITTKLLAAITVLVLLPIAVLDFMHGKLLLAVLISLFVMILACVTYLLHRSTKYFPVIQWCIPPLMIYILAHAAMTIGTPISYWLFPGIIALYFIIPLAVAFVISLIMIATASGVALYHIDYETAIRFIAALVSVNLLVLIFVVVIDRQRWELKRIAITDPLTQLLNRSTLNETLNKSIQQHKRSHIPMCLLAIDLDHFKLVNDTYGHDAGDRVLINLANILRKQTRATDIVFREGGEEFLVLLFNTNERDAIQQAERIREAIMAFDDHMPTASIGVAELNENDSVKDWMKRADNHLYQAKESGRNRVSHTLSNT